MTFTNIETAWVQSYGRNVQMLSQQENSRLMPFVMKETPTGERHYFELYGSHDEPGDADVRHADLNYQDTAFTRVAVDLVAKEDARLISKFDDVKTLVSLVSPVVMAQGAQFGRWIDKQICVGALADMKTGKTGSSTSALTQTVAINSWAYGEGSGNSNLTVSKILEAKANLDASEAPADGRYFVVDAINHTKLLATAEASSRDFVSSANIEKGVLKYFGGFEFIHTEQVQSDSNGYKRCFAFQKTGIGMAVNKEPMSDISENKGKSGLPWQAYYCMQSEATRLDNGKVVEVKCLAT
jgi:hypothetical protein